MGLKLASWGQYPYSPQTPHNLYWQSDVASELRRLSEVFESTLPFGLGRSYGDSCLAQSNHVLHTTSLKRFIHADWQKGILRAEAGMSLEEVLRYAIPQGWFLPTSPGTKYVTLGGAVANDVHGKNHHVSGTFGNHVTRFQLVRSDRPAIECSAKENVELFNATIGGLGLTGIITWVEIQLIPISSTNVDTLTIRFDSLSKFFSLSREFDSQYPYTMAWVDCLASGRNTGRGVYLAGRHSHQGPLLESTKNKKTVPFNPPVSAVNLVSIKAFNFLYFHKHSPVSTEGVCDYDPFFYPLDAILHWNRIYGQKGFQQYQCVIPEENAEPAMNEILKTTADMGSGSMLAVLKRCGNICSPGILSFPKPGLSLALDFPQNDFLNQKLFPRLDKIVRESSGRLYPAKDAHMSGEDFRHFYPQWQKVEALRDPTLCSQFWKRVTQ